MHYILSNPGFWSLWIFAALLLFCCCYRCHRRRREGVRYVVMNNSEYPSYGTVVHPPRVYNAPPPSYTVPPAVAALPPGVIPAGAVPTKPPSYAAAEASVCNLKTVLCKLNLVLIGPMVLLIMICKKHFTRFYANMFIF